MTFQGDQNAQDSTAMQRALVLARHLMPFKAVRVEVLDEHSNAVLNNVRNSERLGAVVASGFLLRESNGLYLYTCWHVATGIDLSRPVLPGPTAVPRRKFRLSLQAVEQLPIGGVSVGGLSTEVVDLYDMTTTPATPLWEQDERSAKNESLSLMNLTQPFWHDAIRIRVPDSLQPAEMQVLTPRDLYPVLVAPGDPLFVVGYPYGYSVKESNPTPIVLRRSVAATSRDGARQEVLIDGGGAPGMSGGPVFCESSGRLFLYGIYTGVIFPDAAEGVTPERTTALGTVCSLGLTTYLRFAPIRLENGGAV